MKLSVFQASGSLFKGLDGDVGADSLWISVSKGKVSTARYAWLTGSLNQQLLHWPAEPSWDIWGN